jgi:hypothetical protein
MSWDRVTDGEAVHVSADRDDVSSEIAARRVRAAVQRR